MKKKVFQYSIFFCVKWKTMTIVTRVSSGCQDQLGNKFVGGGHKSTN
jgi:hypothetical protein